MIIGIVGCRRFTNADIVFDILNMFVKHGDGIISGGATGVDSLAEDYAKLFNIDFMCYAPESPTREAYLARNLSIAKTCDVLIAFPSQYSHGTWDTIRKAQHENKRVIIHHVRS